MRLIIAEDGNGAAQWVAAHVKRCILEFAPTAERPFVLGLPTGSSPVATYKVVIHHFPPISLCSNYPPPPKLLVDYVRKGELSFKHVVTFNMDEYVGTAPWPCFLKCLCWLVWSVWEERESF